MTMAEKDELAILRDSVKELQGRQEYLSNQFQNDMQTIKSLLLQLTGQLRGDVHLPGEQVCTVLKQPEFCPSQSG